MIYRHIVAFAALALLVLGCGSSEKALLEIDFSGASEWKYLLGADMYGTSETHDSLKNFAGSLRAYLQGLPGESSPGTAKFGLRDVTFNAPFFPDDERDDIHSRLTDLRVTLSDSGLSISDTIGIPGVMAGGWDIMRCLARVLPVMPNTEMRVGTSWEREQRFPLSIEQGQADGFLYQFFTLDSLIKTEEDVPVAAFSWVFTYRVSLHGGGSSSKKYPLSGSGRGTAELDLNQKKLLKSKATFQVTHSQKTDMDLNEIVHFEMVE